MIKSPGGACHLTLLACHVPADSLHFGKSQFTPMQPCRHNYQYYIEVQVLGTVEYCSVIQVSWLNEGGEVDVKMKTKGIRRQVV